MDAFGWMPESHTVVTVCRSLKMLNLVSGPRLQRQKRLQDLPSLI